LNHSAVTSRGALVLSLLNVGLFVCAGRFAVRRVLYAFAARGLRVSRIIVVGANGQAISVARDLDSSRSATSEVAGLLSEYHPLGTELLPGLRVIGEPLQLVEVARHVGADRAVVVESGLSWESTRHVMRMMHRRGGPDISIVPGLYGLHATSMRPQQIGPVLTLSPRSAQITGFDAFLKRGLDLAVGSLALLVSLPLIGLLVAHALLSGNGTGLVREEYVDGRGRYKLVRFAASAWAARAHVSRLPNLAWVVSGRMSLLGPRPVPIARVAEYAEALPLLESAKSGFIGPWWLAGRQRPAAVAVEVGYDLHYLGHYTIWFDLQMLIHVARAILLGHISEPVAHLAAAPTSGSESSAPQATAVTF
jgi:lipopolysaccharide/colanic/teichoic acid biosynthesis glycosyltransferase